MDLPFGNFTEDGERYVLFHCFPNEDGAVFGRDMMYILNVQSTKNGLSVSKIVTFCICFLCRRCNARMYVVIIPAGGIIIIIIIIIKGATKKMIVVIE